MLTAYTRKDGTLKALALTAEEPVPEHALWVDLREPTVDERRVVDRWLGIDVPTSEEMQEIEASSRLYQEHGALYLTAMLIAQADTDQPHAGPVTFVLAEHRLVTLRYVDPTPFGVFAAQLGRPNGQQFQSGEEVMGGLLDAIVDRLADILERVQHEMDAVSHEVFREHKRGAVDYNVILRRLGRLQGLNSRARESLVSINRLLAFLGRPGEMAQEKILSRTLRTVSRDVGSLSDHSSYLSGDINFLLDATLGLINNEQNNVIKIFSIAAVVFLPPTLIASIYGMNFRFMPELHWTFGYPFSIGLMIGSAVLTYWFFKKRGWL
jgi:magnesium transporter